MFKNEESHQGRNPSGFQKSCSAIVETSDTPALAAGQVPSPEVLSWLDAHEEHLLPGRMGFGWMPEAVAGWRWPKSGGKPFRLSEVAAQGAMFVTSCRYDKKPLRAPDERKDIMNLAVMRFGHLCLDFDSKENPSKALNDLRQMVFLVLPPLGIPPEHVAIFMSGGKGFHCIVYAPSLGLEDGDRLLPRIYKKLAVKIGAGLSTLDSSIYNLGRGRQFRLPQIKRGNGLHKIPLTLDEIRPTGLSLQEMKKLAKGPRLIPLPVIVPCAKDAPIRKLVADIKATVWQAASKPPKEAVTLSAEDRAALAAKVQGCAARLLQTEDYEGKMKNLDEVLASVVVPYCKLMGFSLDESKELFGEWLAAFVGSDSYDTIEKRFEQFEKKWNSAGMPWSCDITRRMLPAFDCGDCPIRIKEAPELSDIFDDDIGRHVVNMMAQARAEVEKEDRAGTYRILAGNAIMAAVYPDNPLLDGLMDEGESLGIMAANGLGKSLALMDMALSLADPDEPKLWGRYAKARPLRSLIFQSEVTAKGLQKRLRIMAAANPKLMPLIGSLSFASYEASGRMAGNIEDTRVYEVFMRAIEQAKPDIIMIDPLVSYHDRDENSAEMRRALDRITKLQDATGTAVVLAHHVGENSGTKEVFKGRGSTAIGDWLANILHMEAANEEKSVFKISHCKARNFATTAPFFMTRDIGLRLMPCHEPGSKVAEGCEQAVAALRTLGGRVDQQKPLEEFIRTKHAVSRTQAQRWIETAIEDKRIVELESAGRGKSLGLADGEW